MRFDRFVPAALLFGIGMVPTGAHADFFTSKSSFNASNPGLPVLTFEGIAPSGSYTHSPPAFSGVTFTDAANGSSSQVGVSSASFFGTPTDVLYLNAFEPLTLTFSPNVNAVGFNVASGFGGGTATLTVFNGATLLDTESVTTTSEHIFTTFTGFSNLGNITSLTIKPAFVGFVLMDNLAFGTVAPAAVTPEPGSAAVSIGLITFGAGFLFRRRKAVHKAA